MSTQVTELAIVKRIINRLKLGDAGKLGSFFEKQVKTAEKSIRDLKRNLETMKNKYEDEVQDLKDKIEDASEALIDAYDDVTPEDVHNNAAMLAFEDKYWAKVKNAKGKLEDLNKSLEKLGEYYEEEVKKVNKQITAWQERIDVLNGK